MAEDPPINREQKSQPPSPRRKYDFWGVFYFLPAAVICAILSSPLVAISIIVANELYPPKGWEDLGRLIFGAYAVIGAGAAGGIGGAAGGVIRRWKMAMVVGSFVSFASLALLEIQAVSNTTKSLDKWDMLAISIGLAWAGLFGAVGGFLGQWLDTEGQWLNKEDR